MDFDWNCLLGKFQPSQLVCTVRIVDVKLGPQEKLFVLTIFSAFIGLCRVSIMQYMELVDKKLTGPGPEVSVYPGVTFFLSFFFVTFFLTENREAACFTGNYSTLTNRFSSIM